MKEDALLTGLLEPTNEAYAIAKIAGIKMAQMYRKQYGANYISVMPTNLYGPGDNFDLQNSHVLPALIRKFIEAKESDQKNVTIWGTGSRRGNVPGPVLRVKRSLGAQPGVRATDASMVRSARTTPSSPTRG